MELSGANSSEKGHDAKASAAENPLEIIKTPDPGISQFSNIASLELEKMLLKLN